MNTPDRFADLDWETAPQLDKDIILETHKLRQSTNWGFFEALYFVIVEREAYLKQGAKERFQIAYALYTTIFPIYRLVPEGVDESRWKSSVLALMGPQVYFNLPDSKELLYSFKISKAARNCLKSSNRTKAMKDHLTKEHFFTRKEFLRVTHFEIENPLEYQEFLSHYFRMGGVYHITTKVENSLLGEHVKEKMSSDSNYDPLDWVANYEACKIDLVDDVS